MVQKSVPKFRSSQTWIAGKETLIPLGCDGRWRTVPQLPSQEGVQRDDCATWHATSPASSNHSRACRAKRDALRVQHSGAGNGFYLPPLLGSCAVPSCWKNLSRESNQCRTDFRSFVGFE